jgi:two-component system sensor histidine kinase/response regulator
LHNPPICRLLIVDDDPVQATALCRTLEMEGYSTTATTSGSLALAALRTASLNSSTAFDIILVDLMMPGIDGISLLRAAKEIDGDLVGIVVTGHATMETAIESMKNGAFDYIAKPIYLKTLIPVLYRAFVMRRFRIDNTELQRKFTSQSNNLEEATRQLHVAYGDLETLGVSVARGMREPLSSLIGVAKVLSTEELGSLNAKQLKHAEEIVRGGKQLIRLTDDLLRFAQLGRQALRKERVIVSVLVQDIFHELIGAASNIKVDLRTNALPDAFADPSLLRQVFVNLLSNAIKFTGLVPHSMIEVQGTKDSDECTYSIRDNGVGFDMARAQRLFTMSHRLHSAEQFPGPGVGLALVERIVGRHGGRIWAEAEIGKGAKFSFALPE